MEIPRINACQPQINRGHGSYLLAEGSIDMCRGGGGGGDQKGSTLSNATKSRLGPQTGEEKSATRCNATSVEALHSYPCA